MIRQSSGPLDEGRNAACRIRWIRDLPLPIDDLDDTTDAAIVCAAHPFFGCPGEQLDLGTSLFLPFLGDIDRRGGLTISHSSCTRSCGSPSWRCGSSRVPVALLGETGSSR